jgi:chemotaxis signal transduction protein
MRRSAVSTATSAQDRRTVRLGERLADLRRAFDQSFAEPPPPAAGETVDLLAVRMAGVGFAVRLSDTGGLFADRVVAALPAAVPDLLGVASFRGVIVAVYDLAALLGHPPATAPRWMLLDTGTPPLALAFDSIDGHLRVPAAAIAAAAGDPGSGDAGRREACTVVRTADGLRRVVDITEVREAIVRRVGQTDRGRRR